MLMGGDDISNDVITLGTYFSMFFYIRARFCFALSGGNLTAQSTGSHWESGGGIQIQVASSDSFSRSATRSPRRACSQAIKERPQELRDTRRMGEDEGLS